MNKKINFPNLLIIIRLLLVPLILIILMLPSVVFIANVYEPINTSFGATSLKEGMLLTDLIAGILFIIAAFTDWLDGWWARRYNQVTKFGKLFDPLADKILINSVLIVFSARGIIPFLFPIIFITRDILVDGLRMMLASDGIVLSADRFGKLKTLFQIMGLILLFFIHPIYEDCGGSFIHKFMWFGIEFVLIIPLSFGLFFSIISGINYYKKGFKSYKKNR